MDERETRTETLRETIRETIREGREESRRTDQFISNIRKQSQINIDRLARMAVGLGTRS